MVGAAVELVTSVEAGELDWLVPEAAVDETVSAPSPHAANNTPPIEIPRTPRPKSRMNILRSSMRRRDIPVLPSFCQSLQTNTCIGTIILGNIVEAGLLTRYCSSRHIPRSRGSTVRIGILTGGGDVPGLNPAIKALVNRAEEAGHTIVGLRRGWGALLNTDLDDPASIAANTLALDRLVVRKIDRTGGTFLHSSRTNPGWVSDADIPHFLDPPDGSEPPHDFTSHALRVVEALGLDALVAIGGDDTLSYALRMHNEGVPVVAIPKTMDNDVNGTDYCIGFSTALTRCVGFVTNLRSAVGSHERIAVVELFGRYSGATSLFTAYLAAADRAVISEVPFDVDRLAQMAAADRAANPSNYSIVVISEGATMIGGDRVETGEADAYGHRKLGGIGQQTGDMIKAKTGIGIMNQHVGYLMRSGPPDTMDLMIGFNFGTMASELVLSGVSGRMVGIQDGKYTTNDLSVLAAGARSVDIDAYYDAEQYRPNVHALAGKPMFLY